VIQPYTEIIKLVPEVEGAVTSRAGLSEWPRLHCIIFFKDKDDPSRMERARVHSWCMPNLREVYSDLDKNHSRAVAEQVTLFLVKKINGLEKPEDVASVLHLMVESPGVIRPFMDILEMGAVDDDD